MKPQLWLVESDIHGCFLVVAHVDGAYYLLFSLRLGYNIIRGGGR